MTSIPLPPRGTSAVPPPQAQSAPVRARVTAAAVDAAASIGSGAVLLLLLHLVAGQSLAVSLIVALFVVVAARGAVLAWSGWSLGGWVTGVRMVDAKTLSPSPMGAFLYTELTLVVVVATLGLGMLLLMRSVREDPQHRGWHDRVSGLTALSTPRHHSSHRQPTTPREPTHTGPWPQAGAGSQGASQAPPQAAQDSHSPGAAESTPPTRPTPPLTRRGLRRLSAASQADESQARDMPHFANESSVKAVPSQPMDAQPPTEQPRPHQQPPTSHSPQPVSTQPPGRHQESAPGRVPGPVPAAPQQENVFPAERYSFASRRPRPAPAEVAHTFDTASIASAGNQSTQALIDSVPWSAVPTSLDPTTVDSLPDQIRTIIEDEHLMPSPEAADPASSGPGTGADSPHHPSQPPMDLLDPSGVPAPASAASTSPAPSEPSPAVTAPRSEASPDVSSPAIPTAASSPLAASPASATHQAPQGTVPSTIEVPALRASQTAASQAAPHAASQTAEPPPAQAPTRRSTSLSQSARHTGTPAPSLSVQLVPLLGGEPIVIHEPTVIGRDPDNISSYPGAERISLSDPTRSVSKTHAAIFPLLDGVWVTDLHSTNGSRVEHKDGSSVQAVPDVALAALEGTTVFFGRIGFRIEVMG